MTTTPNQADSGLSEDKVTPIDLDGPFPLENQALVAQSYKTLWNKRVEERSALRKLNTGPDYEKFEKLVKGKKLDSNLKKCTAFVRKMKQFVESQKASIESDLNMLNLTKYQSEIATVIVEGRLKQSDITAIVAISSEIHRRYAEFNASLMENFKKVLPTKKIKVEPSVISKVSSDLRLYSELLLAGILPQQEGAALLITTIKNMTFVDKEGIQFLIPFATLLRGLTDSLLGKIPSDVLTGLQNNGVELKDLTRCDSFVKERKSELQNVFKDYFEVVTTNVVEKHEALLKSEKYNRKLLQTRGEIPTDRQEAHAEISSKFEKYQLSASKLAYLLDLPMPTLAELPADPEDDLEKALLTTDDGEILTEVPGIVLFDNEETRQFYQDYPDLKVYLPPVVYRENILQMQEKTKKQEEMEKMVDEFDADLEQAELQEEKEGADEEIAPDMEGDLPPSMRNDEKETAETKETAHQPLRQAFLAYLDNLQNCVNKNMIDKAGIEFAEGYNNKRHRKELVRRLFMVPRQRMDLIPLYSRLVAILSHVFPDIGMDLCTLLQKDFRYLVFKKDQIKIETKLKITRFIGELVNFSIFPKSEAFNCLKILLRNFVHHQVEMACTFVETCGRFLFRSPDSHRRMKIYVDEMMRKKTVRNLEPRYQYMMDNAYCHICPPASGSIHRRKKPELEAFLDFVLCQGLSKQTLQRADEAMRMINFEDSEKFKLVTKILSTPWSFSYSQIDCAASLVALMKRYAPKVVNAVIENLNEYIRVGCDYPVDEMNTFRLSTCQYLAYIYTYRVISTTTLFNIWYFLISYGVTYSAEEYTPLDPPDAMHRVRMIGQMLKICGDYFTSSSSKRRLNCFLKYFQRYYIYKRTLPCWELREFPYSVQEYYEDVMKRLRSRWKLAKTVEEAEKDIMELDGQLRGKVKSADLQTVMSNQTSFVRLSAGASKNRKANRREKDGAPAVIPKPKLLSIQEDAAEDVDQSEPSVQEAADPYELYETGDQMEEEPAMSEKELEDKEFMAALDRMCLEAQQSSTKAMKSDIAMPSVSVSRNTEPVADRSLVNVTFVTKKNNKQKLKTLVVPADEDFLVNLKSREEAEKLEKQRMKSRTLAITRMQEEEEQREEEETAKSFSKTLTFKR